MKINLAKEEKEILDSFEKGEWIPVTCLLHPYLKNILEILNGMK